MQLSDTHVRHVGQDLVAMREADPTAKAVVFSSWIRVLHLVSDALNDNSIQHASLSGYLPGQRSKALQSECNHAASRTLVLPWMCYISSSLSHHGACLVLTKSGRTQDF